MTSAQSRAEAAYLRMLDGVAQRAARMEGRVIASHWPFVGSDYRRLLVVGQALAGWDDETSPALWRPMDLLADGGPRRVLELSQRWAAAKPEPISEPLRTRSGSGFWKISERVVMALEPTGAGPWFSRSAWWNLFPLGWGDRVESSRSPSGPLWMAQVDHVADLFWSTVEVLDPKRVIILAGKGYWDPMAGPLGLADLELKRKPLIAADLRDGRTFVWSYHPQGRGLGARDAFAEAIVNAVREAEAIGGLERARSGP